MSFKVSSRVVWGLIFIFFGVMTLADMFGVIGFSFWSFFNDFWPIGLILAGLLIMFKKKFLAFFLFFLFLFFGFMSNFFVYDVDYERAVTFSEVLVLNESVEVVQLDLDFGLGELSVEGDSFEGDEVFEMDYLVFNDVSKPKVFVSEGEFENWRRVEVWREDTGVDLKDLSEFSRHNQRWDLVLNEELEYELSLYYGLADVDLDLRGLDVRELNIENGVSDSKVRFGEYPTVVEIEAGVSDLSLEFPKGYPVKVEFDGGLYSKNLEGFKKFGDSYRTDGLSEDEPYIYVYVVAGVSDIGTFFYSE